MNLVVIIFIITDILNLVLLALIIGLLTRKSFSPDGTNYQDKSTKKFFRNRKARVVDIENPIDIDFGI